MVIAVAGTGKTELVAQWIALEPKPERTMLLTYLTRNQIEDSARIAGKLDGRAGYPRVMGWFSFLLNEIVRPYSKLCWSNIDRASVWVRAMRGIPVRCRGHFISSRRVRRSMWRLRRPLWPCVWLWAEKVVASSH